MAAVKQAVVFRAHPAKEQQAMLRSWMGACRFVWSRLVAWNKDLCAARRRFAFHGELSALLPEMRRIEGHEWLADVPAVSLADVARSYGLALRNALADRKAIRAGRKLGGRARGAVTISKLGRLRVRGGRWPHGRIFSATMALKAGQWSLSMRSEGEAPWTGAAPEEGSAGDDLGLASFLTWDDGAEVRSIDPPRHLRKAEKELRRRQRRASRCAKGSARRKRRVRAPGRIRRQVANRRGDFPRQTSRLPTAEAGVIGPEDMGVQATQRNRRLAKPVGDAGMAELVRQIRYEADWRGRVFVRIDRWKRSTGVCPDCGTVHGRLDLSVRIWTCEGCGAVHDRGAAAARAIRPHAMELVGKAFPNQPRQRGERAGRADLRGVDAVCVVSRLKEPRMFPPMSSHQIWWLPSEGNDAVGLPTDGGDRRSSRSPGRRAAPG